MVVPSEYPLGVSVVICCFNSSQRLPVTLLHLARQQFSKAIPWEVVVVDNASKDDTSKVALEEWNKYAVKVPLRIIEEPVPGTGHAREAGIGMATYEFILFCDDDNWLSSNYIELAYDIMCSNNEISAIGGRAIEVCEIPPPCWFTSLKAAYSIGGQGSTPHGEISKERGFIYTAGGVFRKSVLTDIHKSGFTKVLTGRTGKSLAAGEDVEICYAMLLSGRKIFYDERLQFQHFLPKARLNWRYFKKMTKGFGDTFPFLMPYKILINKESMRYAYGINWLYISAFYLIGKNLFVELPLSIFKKNYHRVRSNLSSHVGFLTSLLQNHSSIQQLYKTLATADWIAEEYKYKKEKNSKSV